MTARTALPSRWQNSHKGESINCSCRRRAHRVVSYSFEVPRFVGNLCYASVMTLDDLSPEARSQILLASSQVPRRVREAFIDAAVAAFGKRDVIKTMGDLREFLAKMQRGYRVAPTKE